MEMVGRRSASSGQGEFENWEKVNSLGDNEDRFMGVPGKCGTGQTGFYRELSAPT